MSAKRSRLGRSSSTSGFNNCQWFKNIEPPCVTPRDRPTPAPAPKPVQKQTKPVVVFTVGPFVESRERKDDVREDFLKKCSHCKRNIAKDVTVYMYGSLQAFCSLECRDARIAIDEKNRKPSRLQSRPLKEPVKPVIVFQMKNKCSVS